MGELDRLLRMIQGAMAGGGSGYGSMTEMELAQMMRPLGILGGGMLGDVSGLGIVSDRENELMNQANRRLQQLKALEERLLLQRLMR